MKRLIAIVTAIVIGFGFCTNTYCVTEEIPLNTYIQFCCEEIGRKENISPTILMSLIYQESRGKHKNLTQVTKLRWFKEGIEELNLKNVKKDEYENIRLCAYYLHKWFEEYEDMGFALMCWNEGYESAKKKFKKGKYSYYSIAILERSAEWEEIYFRKVPIRNSEVING